MLVNGGFANQLYRYACAYATAKKYQQKLVIIAQTADAATDPFQLGELNIEYSELYVTRTYIETYVLLKEWRQKYSLKDIGENEYLETLNQKLFQEYDGVILWGAYQYPVFYKEFINDIRNIFKFKQKTSFLNIFSQEICDKISVAIHVRRGDFLTYDNLNGGMDYYKAAMVYMEDALGYQNVHYYIFSDDKKFVKTFFGNSERIHYVAAYGDYREAIEEFMAISMCSHRILTVGSSFGRMADAINENDEGYAIYQRMGFENYVYPKKNTIYLSNEDILLLTKYYEPLFKIEEKKKKLEWTINQYEEIARQCIDTKWLEEKDEIEIRVRKLELLNKEKRWGEALGQARKLWEIVYGTRYEGLFHKLYWECLYEYGYREESIIEAIYVKELVGTIGRYYNLEEQQYYKDLSNMSRKKIVIIPSRQYEPHIFEDLIHVGAFLKRMGHDVTFMFWELTPEMNYYKPYNKMLNENKFYEDVMGHNTHCKQINLNEEIRKYGSAENYFEKYFNDKDNTILLFRQKEILDTILRMKENNNIVKVFWDYSNYVDAGNYKEVDNVNVIMQNIKEEDMEECYLKSDYYVSFMENRNDDGRMIKLDSYSSELFNRQDKETVADYYRVDSSMIKNIFKVIKNLEI